MNINDNDDDSTGDDPDDPDRGAKMSPPGKVLLSEDFVCDVAERLALMYEHLRPGTTYIAADLVGWGYWNCLSLRQREKAIRALVHLIHADEGSPLVVQTNSITGQVRFRMV